MKIGCVPDVHNKTALAEECAQYLLEDRKVDEVVFTGDYFDDFYDGPADADRVAKWLIESLKDSRRIHLLGNHDLGYYAYSLHGESVNNVFLCGGFTFKKAQTVLDNEVPWDKIRLLYTAASITGGPSALFLSHAGRSRRDGSWKDPDYALAARESLHANKLHPFFNVGFVRGGWSACGGPLWCHFGYGEQNEFVPTPGVAQCFGHTPQKEPVLLENGGHPNLCLDTHLRHVAIYDSEAVDFEIIPTEEFASGWGLADLHRE